MKQTISINVVARCTVPECIFNRDGECYARAITIGNGNHAECETFLSGNHHIPTNQQKAGVGACKSKRCLHNRDFACDAEQVYVGYDERDGFMGCQSFRK